MKPKDDFPLYDLYPCYDCPRRDAPDCANYLRCELYQEWYVQAWAAVTNRLRRGEGIPGRTRGK